MAEKMLILILRKSKNWRENGEDAIRTVLTEVKLKSLT